jgi:hypothetical protein
MTSLLSDSTCGYHSSQVQHGDRMVMGRGRRSPAQVDEISIPGFDVTGFIARGGVSRVYRGKDQKSGREVALKVVPLAGDQTDET